ncbi:Pectin lyase-like superfamily protein [Abeliophyllum distichum]|uniref:Pectin lyase-like superfamily protein n=1 Tax=Abeliophyllum distichum TaxID=126358 RepID=A0ABD1PLR7_9LAMI
MARRKFNSFFSFPRANNVIIHYITILAPADSPNTDGIDPDSSSHVCIKDSYISTGDVAVKSGWDKYSIVYGRPSHGGVEDVLAENINLFNMGVSIHLKTNVGRGGVIRNITVSNVYMENVQKGLKISGDVGDHPDEKFTPNALPFLRMSGEKRFSGLIHGLKNTPFSGIFLSNNHLHGSPGPKNLPWQCSDVTGAAIQVSPWPCSQLTSRLQYRACLIELF